MLLNLTTFTGLKKSLLNFLKLSVLLSVKTRVKQEYSLDGVPNSSSMKVLSHVSIWFVS